MKQAENCISVIEPPLIIDHCRLVSKQLCKLVMWDSTKRRSRSRTWYQTWSPTGRKQSIYNSVEK